MFHDPAEFQLDLMTASPKYLESIATFFMSGNEIGLFCVPGIMFLNVIFHRPQLSVHTKKTAEQNST